MTPREAWPLIGQEFFFVCETLSVKICPIPVKPCLSLSGRARDREKKAAQSARLLLPASGEIVADNCPDSSRSSHSSDPLPLGDDPSTWDPYGWDDLFDVSKKVPPPIERTDAVVQTRVETNDAAVQTEPWPPVLMKRMCVPCACLQLCKKQGSLPMSWWRRPWLLHAKDITRMGTKSWKLSRTRRTQWVACLMGHVSLWNLLENFSPSPCRTGWVAKKLLKSLFPFIQI